jgi:hypothetical protein
MVDVNDVNVQGYNALDAARSFGVRNTAATQALAREPVTTRDFSESNGDLDANADRISLSGGINLTVPRVEDGLQLSLPTITGEIVQNTNPVNFAVQNSFEQPLERQGKLVGDSGGINTTA